ncbi:hypothetical protein GCM10011591_26560 [Nocardia camponoti]|uniref:Uncharacterized protein n=1 Tax=Nocardia camponoti TaxID=1616106 RepID=A0A917V9W4_9NOCA|nr:hypothetical protein GCM10011591_26560 [Nocardia camponoti]
MAVSLSPFAQPRPSLGNSKWSIELKCGLRSHDEQSAFWRDFAIRRRHKQTSPSTTSSEAQQLSATAKCNKVIGA